MPPLEARQQAAKFAKENPNASLVSAFIAGYLFATGNSVQEPSVAPAPANNISVPTFDDFYNAYGFKKARKQTERMWSRLSYAKKVQIMNSIPAYLQYIHATGTAQMHPSTYINPANERWLDENNVQPTTPPAKKPQQVYRNEGLTSDEQERSRAIAERRRQIIEENLKKQGLK